MTGTPDTEPFPDQPGAEVAFWRGFIEYWAREHDEPVPERAWAALGHAEQRSNSLLERRLELHQNREGTRPCRMSDRRLTR